MLQGAPRMIRVREKLIPLLHLASAFGIDGATTRIVDATVVIIEDADRQLALVVDELFGKYEVVIKSLGDAFGHVRGVAGGAILGDGIGLIRCRRPARAERGHGRGRDSGMSTE